MVAHRQMLFELQELKGWLMIWTDARKIVGFVLRLLPIMLIGLFWMEMLLLPVPAQAVLTDLAGSGSEYVLNENHSRIAFSIGHFFVSSTQGQFTEFDGKMSFDPQAPERGSVLVHIYPSSISTDIAARDDHLRTSDFFDVAKYPTAIFQSKSLEKDTSTTGTLIGTFSLHGVTKPMTLNFTLLSPDLHADRLDFSAVGTLKRSDYGMVKYKGIIGDEVSLNIEAEFDRKR